MQKEILAMSFYPAGAAVPTGLETDEFRLRMLRASDVALDYQAVMGSQAMLLVKSGGGWPREGFSLEDNLADLELHEREHLERVAFTYTVMNPDESECLGCVYIRPLRAYLQLPKASLDEPGVLGEDEPIVHFWVLQSRLGDGLEGRVFDALRGWLRTAWPFARVAFRANQKETGQRALFGAVGLRRVETLRLEDGSRSYDLYEANCLI
jgi:hypothetical protein